MRDKLTKASLDTQSNLALSLSFNFVFVRQSTHEKLQIVRKMLNYLLAVARVESALRADLSHRSNDPDHFAVGVILIGFTESISRSNWLVRFAREPGNSCRIRSLAAAPPS
jgi:hypothetical protein